MFARRRAGGGIARRDRAVARDDRRRDRQRGAGARGSAPPGLELHRRACCAARPASRSPRCIIVALGIGATTAAFSVTDFVLLRPLPFPEPDRLVRLYEKTPAYSQLELSAANYRDWKQGSTVFESIGLHHGAAGNLVGIGEPLRVDGTAVSYDLFPTLRVQPLIGRLVHRDRRSRRRAGHADPQLPAVADAVRRRPVDRRPAAAARRRVVHASSASCRRRSGFRRARCSTGRRCASTREMYVDRNDNWHYAVGRLRAGVTLEQAQAEMDVLAARSRQQFPAENKDVGRAPDPLDDDGVSQQAKLLLYALSGAAACVLLIACANLANLLLARALERRRELAVRTAMGAGRERMIRQLMTESLLLAVGGGALGVAIAYAAVPLLNRLVPTDAAAGERADGRSSRAAVRDRADRRHRPGLRPGAAAARRRRGRPRRPARRRALGRRPEGRRPLDAGRRRDRRVGRAAGVGRAC